MGIIRIISGRARGVPLASPPGPETRPTAVRARKALFDSLGNFAGLEVLDLCAGTGAGGLEAASRGAAKVVFIEQSRRQTAYLERNVEAVRRIGVETECVVLTGDILDGRLYRGLAPDFVFADPPYADSARLYAGVMALPEFRRAVAGARLAWEIPDHPGAAGDFLTAGVAAEGFAFRGFGGTAFLLGTVRGPEEPA